MSSIKVEQPSNKQLMHIAGELAVAAGLIFWFSSKTKKLTSHVEELTNRMDEQDEQIQKLQASVVSLNNMLSKLSRQQQQEVVRTERKKEKVQPENNKVKTKPVNPPKTVSFVNKIQPIEEEDENATDSDIDDEIRTELQELELDTSLKKRE